MGKGLCSRLGKIQVEVDALKNGHDAWKVKVYEWEDSLRRNSTFCMVVKFTTFSRKLECCIMQGNW